MNRCLVSWSRVVKYIQDSTLAAGCSLKPAQFLTEITTCSQICIYCVSIWVTIFNLCDSFYELRWAHRSTSQPVNCFLTGLLFTQQHLQNLRSLKWHQGTWDSIKTHQYRRGSLASHSFLSRISFPLLLLQHYLLFQPRLEEEASISPSQHHYNLES